MYSSNSYLFDIKVKFPSLRIIICHNFLTKSCYTITQQADGVMIMSHEWFSWRPLGEQAILLQWHHSGDDVTRQMMHLFQLLEETPFRGFVECVPAFQSMSVHFDCMLINDRVDAHTYVANHMQTLVKSIPFHYISKPRKIEIPVFYDEGPDLQELCHKAQLTKTEWVTLHTSIEYTVACIGFTPGFPYLSGLPELLRAPRRAKPRTRVPAGSVAVGGYYCGIYPHESPGGWHIVGRTPLSLFDATIDPPAILQIGDVVRFRAMMETEH